VLDSCKSSPINTSTITCRYPCFPLRRVVAHGTEVSRVRPTYLRTRAKDVVAIFDPSASRAQRQTQGACSAVAGVLRAATARMVEYAVRAEQTSYQRVQRFSAHGKPWKHHAIGDQVRDDEARGATGRLPICWQSVDRLAPLTAGTCGQAGRPPEVCRQSGPAPAVGQPLQAAARTQAVAQGDQHPCQGPLQGECSHLGG
jgi:hypothetical protein